MTKCGVVTVVSSSDSTGHPPRPPRCGGVSLDVWSTVLCLRVVYPHTAEMSPQERRSDHRDRVLGHRVWDAQDDRASTYRGIGTDWIDMQGLLMKTRLFEPGPMEQDTAVQASGFTSVDLDGDIRRRRRQSARLLSRA